MGREVEVVEEGIGIRGEKEAVATQLSAEVIQLVELYLTRIAGKGPCDLIDGEVVAVGGADDVAELLLSDPTDL